MLKALKLLGKAAYTTHIMEDNFDHIADPEAAFETAIRELKDYAGEVYQTYGPDFEWPAFHTSLTDIANHYVQHIDQSR